MEGPASSTTAKLYMQAQEQTAMSATPHTPKIWKRFVDDAYSILKRTNFEKFFCHMNNLHQNIKFTMEKEGNGERAYPDSLLKRSNGKIYVQVHRKPTHTDKCLHYSFHHETSCK